VHLQGVFNTMIVIKKTLFWTTIATPGQFELGLPSDVGLLRYVTRGETDRVGRAMVMPRLLPE